MKEKVVFLLLVTLAVSSVGVSQAVGDTTKASDTVSVTVQRSLYNAIRLKISHVSDKILGGETESKEKNAKKSTQKPIVIY